MREIKYRSAHYKYDGKFSHFSYWGFINHKGEYDKDCFASPSSSKDTYRKVEEQYTGIKDKNGRKVFEGDVVEFVDYNRSYEDLFLNKGTIEYDQFGYVITNRFEVDMEDIDWDQVEVIGNIHENPDLKN